MTRARNRIRGTFRQRANALLMCIGIFAALLWSPSARAYAPMCDESGASIDAPLPAPPADAGEISALDCLPVFEDAERVLPGTPGEPSNLPTVAAELVALLPWAPADVDPSRTGTSLRPTEQLVVAGEHKRRVYRPPCGA